MTLFQVKFNGSCCLVWLIINAKTIKLRIPKFAAQITRSCHSIEQKVYLVYLDLNMMSQRCFIEFRSSPDPFTSVTRAQIEPVPYLRNIYTDATRGSPSYRFSLEIFQ